MAKFELKFLDSERNRDTIACAKYGNLVYLFRQINSN
jgi:hypothetical protein